MLGRNVRSGLNFNITDNLARISFACCRHVSVRQAGRFSPKGRIETTQTHSYGDSPSLDRTRSSTEEVSSYVQAATQDSLPHAQMANDC